MAEDQGDCHGKGEATIKETMVGKFPAGRKGKEWISGRLGKQNQKQHLGQGEIGCQARQFNLEQMQAINPMSNNGRGKGMTPEKHQESSTISVFQTY